MASWVSPPLEDQALEQELDEQELQRVTFLLRQRQQQREGCHVGADVELQELNSHQPARVPHLPQCYLEIKTLMWIENSVVHQKALQEWERKSTLLTARVERKRKLGWNQRNEIYNLVGFFSVFQGVLLTAVSQSNLLHCNNWWSPFTLSVLASLVTFVGVYQKFSYIWSLDKTISSEENTLKAVVKRVNDLRREGNEFRFADCEDSETRKRPEPSRFTVYTFLVFAALASFAVVFAVSHPVILCHSGCNPVNNCS
ncbi:hypothetical protein M758_1G006400 [Ceratodon purpureus]|uniref:Uncharacterized protein n=1 Tax=Ceratodon purpureus TaxID=3225 RepID=A0A8T0J1Z5_CERPU|nr:hypothetical protein KC19_1G007500 [Ceratodon purpureus]KAG0628177.1 hypothetical protein M758_1G006400 [Ceratodon purpureus]